MNTASEKRKKTKKCLSVLLIVALVIFMSRISKINPLIVLIVLVFILLVFIIIIYTFLNGLNKHFENEDELSTWLIKTKLIKMPKKKLQSLASFLMIFSLGITWQPFAVVAGVLTTAESVFVAAIIKQTIDNTVSSKSDTSNEPQGSSSLAHVFKDDLPVTPSPVEKNPPLEQVPVISLNDSVIARIGSTECEIIENFKSVLQSDANKVPGIFCNASGEELWEDADKRYSNFEEHKNDLTISWDDKIREVDTCLKLRIELDSTIKDPGNLHLMALYCIDIADMYLKKEDPLAESYLIKGAAFALEALALNVSLKGKANQPFLETLVKLYRRMAVDVALLRKKSSFSQDMRDVYNEAMHACEKLLQSGELDNK